MSTSLVLSAIVPLGLGYVSSLPARRRIDPYLAELNKPVRHPPSWVFASIAVLQHLVMGYASFLVCRQLEVETNPDKVAEGQWGIGLYWVQVVVGLGYVPAFFGLRRVDLALVVISAEAAAVLATTVCFFGIEWTAGALMLEFWVWVVFATYYTFRIWSLNRGSSASAEASGWGPSSDEESDLDIEQADSAHMLLISHVSDSRTEGRPQRTA